MLQDKKGLTLVEVMIALFVLLMVFLALMQTSLVSINSNMVNVLRDEAVNIAEMSMNEARIIPFDDLTPGTSSELVQRDIRNIDDYPYTVTTTVSSAGTDTTLINVVVTWEWKEKTIANGDPYTHSISTIVRRK